MRGGLALRLWLLLSAFLTAGGWLLSVPGWLNRPAYAGLLALFAAAALFLARHGPRRAWHLPRKRFSRPLAMGFVALAALAVIGGFLYPPDNGDGLSYRTPRVLHWLAEGRWHWIHTPDARLNTRASGFEWMTAPLLLFFRSDRLLFLINAAAFLLLPGALFSFLRRAGAGGRAAWAWSWTLPTGYCFVLQAGGIGNDSFAAVYVLASLAFALRFRDGGTASDLAWSGLALALATGAKASNLPLLLPWAVALAPAWRRLPAALPRVAPAAAAALLASFAPNAILNHLHCGDWSGAAVENSRFTVASPWVGLAGNALLLLWQNLVPPLFPWAGAWNAGFPGSEAGRALEWMSRSFEPGYWHASFISGEGSAGLGIGIVALIGLALALRRKSPAAAPRRERILRWAPWVSLAALVSKTGLYGVSRIVAPYYPLFLPGIASGAGAGRAVRHPLWRAAAAAAWALALLVVVLNPSRPLWPAAAILSRIRARHPEAAPPARAAAVYAGHASAWDALGPLREALPPGTARLGVVRQMGNDLETSLWRPFGSRTLYEIVPGESPAALREARVEWVILSGKALRDDWGMTPEEWLAAFGGREQLRRRLTLGGPDDSVEWIVARVGGKP